jgi:hypothetical protein
VILSAGSCLAQVTAKTEAPPEDPSKIFRSPMVLSVPVPAVSRLIAKDSNVKSYLLDLRELRDYECDAVVIARVTGTAKERRIQRSDAVLELKIFIRIKPGIDKLVDVKAELLVDDEVIGIGRDRRIDAEERKRAQSDLVVPFRMNRLKEDVTPILRLTFTVTDNG